MGHRELDRVHKIACALPEVNERFSHGEPCFFVRDKRPLCYYHENHRGDGRISLWCPAAAGVAAGLAAAEPERFSETTPSAAGVFANWLGVFLDTRGRDAVEWEEITAFLRDAYSTVAPKTRVHVSIEPKDLEQLKSILEST